MNTPNKFSLIEVIREEDDALIWEKIVANEFVHEYLVVDYQVFNTGVVIIGYSFTNDLPEDLAPDTAAFLVTELNQVDRRNK